MMSLIPRPPHPFTLFWMVAHALDPDTPFPPPLPPPRLPRAPRTARCHDKARTDAAPHQIRCAIEQGAEDAAGTDAATTNADRASRRLPGESTQGPEQFRSPRATER